MRSESGQPMKGSTAAHRRGEKPNEQAERWRESFSPSSLLGWSAKNLHSSSIGGSCGGCWKSYCGRSKLPN